MLTHICHYAKLLAFFIRLGFILNFKPFNICFRIAEVQGFNINLAKVAVLFFGFFFDFFWLAWNAFNFHDDKHLKLRELGEGCGKIALVNKTHECFELALGDVGKWLRSIFFHKQSQKQLVSALVILALLKSYQILNIVTREFSFKFRIYILGGITGDDKFSEIVLYFYWDWWFCCDVLTQGVT